MSMESMMPSNHLILCHPLLVMPSIFPSIKVFSIELAFGIRWPKFWSFSFSIWLFVTPWTVSYQAPLFMEFSRQEYWGELLFPTPIQGLNLCHLYWQEDSLPLSHLVSASVLPMNIQGWFPLGLTGLISLQSKGLLRVFSSTTVQKHQLFSAQPSLWSNSLEKL